MTEEKRLGYLLFLVSRGHHNLANRVFNQAGLSRGQPSVLFELGKTDGITQTDLAKTIEVTQATLTNMLHRMEAADLVTRVRDVEDGRFTRIYLTDFGRETLAQAIELKEVMEQTAFAGFSPEEQQILKKYLERVHTNLVRG
jgi:DNA-binding MarR family transcriptional regulator